VSPELPRNCLILVFLEGWGINQENMLNYCFSGFNNDNMAMKIDKITANMNGDSPQVAVFKHRNLRAI
jgi:hypothetical protein